MARRVTLRYAAIILCAICLIYVFRCRRFPVDGNTKDGKLHIAPIMLATDCEIFHLLTMFFNGYVWHGFENYTLRDLNEREKEFLFTLQLNLNHSCVKKVHLFYYTLADLVTINESNLTNRHKLVLVQHTRLLHMSDFFLYASKNLVDRTVIAANSDIVLGEGLQFLDIDKMKRQKIMYSLSRFETDCNTTAKPVKNACSLHGYEKVGTHDTHIFSLGSSLNNTLLQQLDFPINMRFAGNGLIKVMRKTFNFIVENPCLTIKTYHTHCSPVVASRGNSYSLLSLGWSKHDLYRAGRARPTSLEKIL
ncbi:uncharacterized protein [Watersipora subatra]|uniref:uncharacterized protein n=1 Tax=Watersipora subatra TaxID=2589382 RepID=UPI00355C348D